MVIDFYDTRCNASIFVEVYRYPEGFCADQVEDGLVSYYDSVDDAVLDAQTPKEIITILMDSFPDVVWGFVEVDRILIN